MNSTRRLALVGVFAACVLGGFIAAYAWPPRSATQPDATPPDPLRAIGGWLRLMPDQVADLSHVDPDFATQRAALETELANGRERLAEMFEDSSATNAAILEQVEKVIEIHDRLERRVAQYLLALRPRLTDEQRATLFDRCAQGVREAGGWRWRHGANDRGGGGHGRGQGAGQRRGQGPPWARPAGTSGSQPASQPQGERP